MYKTHASGDERIASREARRDIKVFPERSSPYNWANNPFGYPPLRMKSAAGTPVLKKLKVAKSSSPKDPIVYVWASLAKPLVT
jgi:hypothetical protein